MAAYFFRIRGRVFGPFSEEQAKEMIRKGKVGRSNDISEDRINWVQAGNYENLFPKTAQEIAAESTNVQAATAASPAAPDEPAEWFYSVDGQTGFGPVTKSSIDNLVRTGTLGPDSLVWQEGGTANKLKNVFPALVLGANQKSRSSRKRKSDDDTRLQNELIPGAALEPLSKSLGFLMFFRVWFIIEGVLLFLLLLVCRPFVNYRLLEPIDPNVAIIATFMLFLVYASFVFVYFWFTKNIWCYRTEIKKAIGSKEASDLLDANKCLFTLWHSLFWLIIAHVVVAFMEGFIFGYVHGMFNF